ncbi:uncharacterized protein LOC127701611 isoform X2 [Mytilus californianus]|uniref:uncharacterized protein LOC127701611 isoform X2 n=1 Tax=Mytilus californianus TaxID=6549 RepID=UPI002245AC0F|nr:uncharacterized protein LOC127701611 isoform X2 [Mytilus californianus]
MIIGIVTLLFVYVKAIPEVNHLIEIDHMGRKVAMDIIHDTEEKTVIAIVGDVCKYKNGVPRVNFHDYSTGYGAMKNINQQTCVIAKSPVPMASDKKYRIGWTTEVHDHILKVVPEKMSYNEVEALAGAKVAVFCKDYKAMYATITPVKKQRRAAGRPSEKNWCVFSSCVIQYGLGLDMD